MPTDENCALDTVVIVKNSNGILRNSSSRSKSDFPIDMVSVTAEPNGRARRRCRCQHNDVVRQRHNATQTPGSLVNCNQLINCHSHSASINCCGNRKSTDCCSLISGDLKSGEMTSHCHITHHCHHFSPGSGRDGEKRRKKHCGCNNRHHHSHHHRHRHRRYRYLQSEYQQQDKPFRQLPGYNSKSSFDSSDDLQQSGLENPQERLQEIAIEIDAATLTEDNTSTATSNFAYKMAKANIAPIIMAPIHDNDEDDKKQRRKYYGHRCDSMNSSSAGETDELSYRISGVKHKKTDCDNTTIWTESKTYRHENTITPHLSNCKDSQCRAKSRAANKLNAAYNECVRIQRKQFKASGADECCSTCSHCSDCSCQNADATSCSSFDELDADDHDEERRIAPHELVVSAECHRCNFHHASTTSTGDEAEEEEDGGADDKLTAKTAKHSERSMQDNTTDSSAHTSRRSSASFCSCHSSNCYCCECNCAAVVEDDCDSTTGQMLTARDQPCTALTSTAEFDAEHSSTLTPLTNASSAVSTPGAEDADVTLRSLTNTLAEDICSSPSQSAEYFSLSSNNQQSHFSPTETPTHRPIKTPSESTTAGTLSKCNLDKSVDSGELGKKTCKHYTKHHRHKRPTSPMDCYL